MASSLSCDGLAGAGLDDDGFGVVPSGHHGAAELICAKTKNMAATNKKILNFILKYNYVY